MFETVNPFSLLKKYKVKKISKKITDLKGKQQALGVFASRVAKKVRFQKDVHDYNDMMKEAVGRYSDSVDLKEATQKAFKKCPPKKNLNLFQRILKNSKDKALDSLIETKRKVGYWADKVKSEAREKSSLFVDKIRGAVSKVRGR